jgi:hypothetical protein
MANTSWWIVSRALRVGMVGLSLGVIAGLSCLVLGSPADVANLAGVLHWVLIVLVPVLTWVVARNDLIGDTAAAYATRSSAVGRLLLVGLLGALLANALYFTLVLNVPVALKGFEALAWRTALDRQIGGEQYMLALAATAVIGLVIAYWAQRKAAAQA